MTSNLRWSLRCLRSSQVNKQIKYVLLQKRDKECTSNILLLILSETWRRSLNLSLFKFPNERSWFPYQTKYGRNFYIFPLEVRYKNVTCKNFNPFQANVPYL